MVSQEPAGLFSRKASANQFNHSIHMIFHRTRYLYHLQGKYDQFNRNFNGNWSETVAEIHALEPQVASLSASNTQLEGDMTNVKTNINKLNTSIDSVATSETQLSSSIDGINTTIRTLTKDLGKAQLALGALETAELALKNEADQMKTNVSKLATGQATNTAALGALQKTLQTLTTEVGTWDVDANGGSVSDRVSALLAFMTSAQKSINKNVGDIGTHTTELTSLFHVSGVNAQAIKDVNTSLTSLNSTLTAALATATTSLTTELKTKVSAVSLSSEVKSAATGKPSASIDCEKAIVTGSDCHCTTSGVWGTVQAAGNVVTCSCKNDSVASFLVWCSTIAVSKN